MKTNLTFQTLVILTLLLIASTSSFATQRTWNGSVSTDYGWAANWTPSGVPASTDTITIIATTNTCYLDQGRTVSKFTMTSGTMNLNDSTLTITGTATFNSGTINNGALSILNGSATTTFNGTTFGATITAVSAVIAFNGSVFNAAVIADKTGSTTSVGTGSNTFNAPVTLIKSGSGAFTLAANTGQPDIFNSTLHIIQGSSGNFNIAHNSTGNEFNGAVTFSSRGAGAIFSNYYGTAIYKDSIILDSLSCNLTFGNSTGSCIQTTGHRIVIGPHQFNDGTFTLRNFTQQGTTDTLHFSATADAVIAFESGSVFNSPVNVSTPRLYLNRSRFNSVCSFIQNGASTISDGGCYFAASTTIKNNSNTTGAMSLGVTYTDTFASTAYIQCISNRMNLNNMVFLGNTTLRNDITSGVAFHVANSGHLVFKGNVTLMDAGGTFDFGNSGGTTLLDNGAVLSITTPFTGPLILENFTQRGPDAISFTGPPRLELLGGNEFNAPFTYSGGRVKINGTTFNSSADITRTLASAADVSDGGNVFNGAATITDSSLSARHLTLANLYPDTFNAAVTFIEKGSNTTFIRPAYGANSVFKGNVTVQGSAAIPFGANGGKVIFSGSANQTLNKTGSFGPTFKKIEINKTAGTLKLNIPVTLTTDSFILTSGALITDATNILSVPDNGMVIATTHTGYVHGPVKKYGNDAFTFPLGDTTLTVSGYYWHPLAISAPSTTGVSFTAQYFDADHGHGTIADNTIENVSTCEYWNLTRANSAAGDSVHVTLNWNDNSCTVFSLDSMRVARWDSTQWRDRGNGATTGNMTVGSVRTQYKQSSFGHFALGDKACTTLSAFLATVSTSCYGRNDGLAIVNPTGGTSPYTYSWSNNATMQTNTGLASGIYSVLVTDHNGCTFTDSTFVSLISPYTNAGADITLDLGDTLQIGGTPVDGLNYSWSPSSELSDVSIANPLAMPTSSIQYTLRVTDQSGCTNSDTIKITVLRNPGVNITPGGIFDNVFDQHGNHYKLRDLQIGNPSVNASTLLCTAGYFNLYFEDGSGMEKPLDLGHIARRDVVCQVFTDLSAFISTPNTNVRVNIWVRDIGNISGVGDPKTSGVLGLATPFYVLPSGNTASGITDNEIWKTINSGTDSYTNVASPLIIQAGIYHGMMAINFANTGFNWHTVLSDITYSGYFDLYSIVLHEVTHALGYASLINSNGVSKYGSNFNYYSRYDNFLKTQGAPGEYLITNSGSCVLYNYSFNTNISTSVLAPNQNPNTCTGAPIDNTVCNDAILFAGTVNEPVYTPYCFEPPSSLSHPEDVCHVPFTYNANGSYPNNLYYVMSNANGTGPSFMKRFLKEEEKAVLCDLGYTVGTVYGSTGNHTDYPYVSSACPGLQVAGINDGINANQTYSYIVNTAGTITVSNILSNDYPSSGTHFECLEVILGGGSATPTSGTSFTYTAGSTPGIALLRYVPVNSSGAHGNITYILILVNDPSCVGNSCNRIVNSGFEDASCGVLNSSVPIYSGSLNCWMPLNYTPDVFSRGCTTVPYNDVATWTWFSNPATDTHDGAAAFNNHFLGMGGYINSGSILAESIQTLLNTPSPLVNGQQYTLSFWAMNNNGVNSLGADPLYLIFCTSPTTLAPTLFPGSLNQIASEIIPPYNSMLSNHDNWHYFSTTFTFTPAATHSNLIFGLDLSQYPLNVNKEWYFFIDDISILPTSNVPTFTPPSTLCVNDNISDLSVYVNPQGGSFSGNGVSFSNGFWRFDASVSGAGLQTITYSVNGSGCSIPVHAKIQILSSLPTISISHIDPTTYCIGGNVSLTASGAISYVWSPSTSLSSSTGAVVTANPTSTITYMATGTAANGCSNTSTVTVTVNPLPTISISHIDPTTYCIGGNVSLTASGAISYVWSPSTSLSSSTGAVVTANPTSTITYSVTGTDVNGCSNTSTVMVTVNSLPAVAIDPPNSNTFCAGGNSILTATGANTYIWSPATFLSPTTGAIVTANPTLNTTYTVTATDANGCTNTATATVISAISITQLNPAFCIGSSISLTASGANTYTWSPATNLSASTGVIVTANPTVSTTYTITGTDANGCTNTSTVVVVVNPLPTVNISGLTYVCDGSPLILTSTASGSPPYTYNWSGPNGYASTSASPTVTTTATFSTAGTYSITVTDQNGCVGSTASTEVVIRVTPSGSLYANTNAQFTTTICEGTGGTLMILCGGIGTISGTLWDGVSNTLASYSGTATQINIPVTPPVGTTIYYLQSMHDQYCSAKVVDIIGVDPITVHVNPRPTISIDPPSTTALTCVISSINLTTTASAGVTYSWSPNGETADQINVTSPGTYSVKVTDSYSCENTATIVITQSALPNVFFLPSSTPALCIGTSMALTAGGAITYNWNPATFLSATTGSIVTSNPTSTITYTVTGTDVNGCSNTSTVTVTVNPLPTNPISTSNPAFCIGDNATLTAGNATTYNWSPATFLSSTTGNIVTANPTSTTTYTVTGTNGNGCSNTSTVTVTVNPLPTVTISPSSPRLCVSASSGLTASGGTSYLWSTAETTASITSASSGTYSVTVTNANGCSNSGQTTLSPDLTCFCVDPSNATIIYDVSGTYSATSIPNSLTTLTGYVSISGTFIVDVNFTFSGATVYMAPGATIVIATGNTLTISGSTFLACTDMWNGIFITSSTSFLTINSSSIIKDAKNAVVSQNCGDFKITGSTFDLNYIDIDVQPCTTATTIGDISAGNIFQCSTPIVKAPHAGKITWRGIQIHNVASMYDIVNNTFSNMDFGIHIDNSGIANSNEVIRYNSFANIEGQPQYCLPFGGCPAELTKGTAIYAIVADGTSNSIIADYNNIAETNRAIWLENFVNASASYNIITNTNASTTGGPYFGETGIMFRYNFTFPHLGDVEINHNEMENWYNDIAFYLRDQSIFQPCTLRINNNILSNNLDIANNAIRVSSFKPPFVASDPGIWEIKNNTISETTTGINLLGVFSPVPVISGNGISIKNGGVPFNDLGKRYGIRVQHSRLVYVGENAVDNSGTAMANPAHIGIAMEECPFSEVRANSIENMNMGINCFLPSFPEHLSCNVMGNCNTGVSLGAVPFGIGDQGTLSDPQDNQWFNTLLTTSDIFNNFSFPDNWHYRFATYTPSFTPKRKFLAITPFPNTSPPAYDCPNGPPPPCPAPYVCVHSSLVTLVNRSAAGDLLCEADETGLFITQQHIYEQLRTEDSLMFTGLDDDAVLQDFYDSIASTNLGQLQEVSELIAESSLEDANTLNESISPSNLMEETQVAFNRIYLATFAAGIDTLTVDQMNDLSIIAQQCPAIWGRAVYGARELLSFALDTVINYTDECYLPGEITGPDPTELELFPDAVCPEGTYSFAIDPVEGATDYYWFTNVSGADVIYSDTACSVTFPAIIPMNARVCVAAIDTNGIQGIPRCRYLESGVPATPAGIHGPASNQCNRQGQLYFIDSIPKAEDYTWYVSDDGVAEIDGDDDNDSVFVNFIAPFDSVTLYVVANGVCGSSAPDSIVIYGQPLFPELQDPLSVCCGDTLVFTFADSTITSLQATFHGVFEEGELLDQLLVTADAFPGEENINETYFSQSHSMIYDCENEIYMEADITCSTNPTYIRIILCGNINEDTLTLTVGNPCGTYTVMRIVNDTCYAGDSCQSEEERKAFVNQINSISNIAVYPNPTNGTVTMQFNSMEETSYNLEVTDLTGRILISDQSKAMKGLNYYNFDIGGFAKGIYLIKFLSPTMNKVIRITRG